MREPRRRPASFAAGCWSICPTKTCPGCSMRCSPRREVPFPRDRRSGRSGRRSRAAETRNEAWWLALLEGAARRRPGRALANGPAHTAPSSAGCPGPSRRRSLPRPSHQGSGSWMTTKSVMSSSPGRWRRPWAGPSRSSSCVSTAGNVSATSCSAPACATWTASIRCAAPALARPGHLGRRAQRAGGTLDRRTECRRHPSGPPGTQRRRSGRSLRSDGGLFAFPPVRSSPSHGDDRAAESAGRRCLEGRSRALAGPVRRCTATAHCVGRRRQLGPASTGCRRPRAPSDRKSALSPTPSAPRSSLSPVRAPETPRPMRWKAALAQTTMCTAGVPMTTDNPYTGYLALADIIVVTGESESMLSEAAATGKPC